MRFFNLLMITILASFTLKFNTLYSQSIIELKDGTIIEAYIESKDGATIDYRVNSDSDQTLYFLNKSEVKSIKDKNSNPAKVTEENNSLHNSRAELIPDEDFEYIYYSNRFYLYDKVNNKKRLSKSVMKSMVKGTPAEKYLKSHYIYKNISNGLLIPGAIFTAVGFVGYMIQDFNSYKSDIYLAVLSSGVGLSLVSIPFTMLSNNNAYEAAYQYTKHKRFNAQELSLNFALNGNGFGLVLKF